MAVTAGADEGSLFGPILWNAGYDNLLRLDMPDETRLVGYADEHCCSTSRRTGSREGKPCLLYTSRCV